MANVKRHYRCKCRCPMCSRFDHYLYDYLIPKNMHQTAEVFKNEAKLACFRRKSTIGMSRGSKSMQSIAWHGSDRVFQLRGCSPSSHPEELLTSALETRTKIKFANTIGQEVDSSVHTTAKIIDEEADPEIKNLIETFWPSEQHQKELSTLREISRNVPDLSESVDDNTGMQEFSDLTSEVLQTNDNKIESNPGIEDLLNSFWQQDQKELDDKLTLGVVDDNKSETSGASSNLLRLSTVLDVSPGFCFLYS